MQEDYFNGYHLLIDFYGCENLDLLKSINAKMIERAIIDSGMRVADYNNFRFKSEDDSGSYSFFFILFESHVSGHSWPEYNMINLDVYVCHHSMDNTQKAEKVLKFLENLYKPRKKIIQRVKRGLITEASPSSLFKKIIKILNFFR